MQKNKTQNRQGMTGYVPGLPNERFLFMDEYNIIFVDFDHTICIHKYPINYSDSHILFMQPEEAAVKWFKDSIPNMPLINMLKQGTSKNTRLYLITEAGNLQLRAKESWLERFNINWSGIISISKDMTKLDFMKSVGFQFNYQPEEMLLIDDDSTLRRLCENQNICHTISPQYYAVCVEPNAWQDS